MINDTQVGDSAQRGKEERRHRQGKGGEGHGYTQDDTTAEDSTALSSILDSKNLLHLHQSAAAGAAMSGTAAARLDHVGKGES